MEGFYEIQTVLEIIRNDLITIGAEIVWIGQAIGALGALLYIAKLSYEGMLGGNLFTLKTFRPFALALVLALYPQFMLVIDGIAMGVNMGLGRVIITDEVRVTEILKTRDLNPDTEDDQHLIGIEDIHAEEDASIAATINRLADSVTENLNVFKWVGEKFYQAMMRFLGLEDTVNSVILTQWAWMFLLILIVGYITVPIVAGWVISGSGIGQMGSLLSATIGKGVVQTGGAVGKAAQRARYNPNK